MTKCETCGRPHEATKLDAWMVRNGYSYGTLANLLGTNKNRLWRANHGGVNSRNAELVARIFETTAGEVLPEDLVNPWPGTVREQRRRRLRRLA